MAVQPDILKLAIQAGGGPNVVADKYGFHVNVVYRCIQRHDWPLHLLRPLLADGNGLFTIDQLLAFFEACAAAK